MADRLFLSARTDPRVRRSVDADYADYNAFDENIFNFRV